MSARATLNLPIIDLSSPDRVSTANSIRQACIEFGFFYLVNHGVEEELLREVFDESKKFFSLSLEEKMKLARKEHRGYTPLYAEKLDPTSASKGDSKESYYIGPLGDTTSANLNQWPSKGNPRSTNKLETYNGILLLESLGVHTCNIGCSVVAYAYCFSIDDDRLKEANMFLNEAGKDLVSLISLSLNVDEDFFEKIGALYKPAAFLRLLHYPGGLEADEEIYGASAHSDYGMITLLVTDGVQGLQICKEKFKQPRVWEDVPHLEGAFIVNIGDMMERWTNCLYRSTMHRVMPTGKERYSVVLFFDPAPDCVVECIESCCSESRPPRFPPIRSGDYLNERFRLTYGS